MECKVFRKLLLSCCLILASTASSFALTKYGPFAPLTIGKYAGDDGPSYQNQEQNGSPAFFNDELLSPLQRSLQLNMEHISTLTHIGPSEEDGKANDVVLPQLSELSELSTFKKRRLNKGFRNKMNRQDDKKSDTKKKIEGLKEISWRECSAKNVKVYLDSNVKLRCEFWAPIGSTVTWFKDDLPIRTQHHGNTTFINPTQPSNDVIQSNDVENIGRKTFEFHLKTLYPLDCITEEDEGLYKLQISTPEGKAYKRSFNVKTIGTSRRYSIMYCKYYSVYSQQFDPRIIEFSKTIVGKIGEEMILPCRPNELNSIAINWYNVDRKITPDNYSITDDGDLKIHELSLDDMGMFVCEVFHVVNEITYDQITTFVKVRD